VTLAAAAGSALPWLVAAAVADSLSSTAGAGVTAFAARAEPGLGALGSLAGLGGIWNAQAVPDSRTTLLAALATVVLLAVVALGCPAAIRRPEARPLLVLAVAAAVVTAAMATGPGLAALESVVRVAPGLGLLRDGQKWVALAMPGYVLAAAGIARLGRSAAVIGCVALIAVLPDLARGVGGQLRSVHYPPGWSTVAAMINADPRPVAVLPPDSMREFSWAGDAPVLDPLPRWVSAEVLSSGDLLIGGLPVPGEGGRGREATRLLLDGAPQRELADAGIGWVVVQSADVALNLPVAHKDSDITLYEVGGSAPPAAGRPTLIATHLVWVGLLVVGAIGSLMVWRREARRLR
jgi:hypothetical protein